MKKLIILISVLFLQFTTDSLKAQEQLPKLVSVQIVNATIGPSKVDGSHWSGKGKVDPSVTTKLAQLMMGTVNPYAGVIGLLSSSLISSSGKPAPYGIVEVAVKGQYYPKFQANLVSFKQAERTFTPIFHLPAYTGVPFDEGTRFKITLYSKNLINPQPTPIGVAVINYADLLKAYKEQKIYQVPVADQTENQLLFIGIEVDSASTLK
jgi:hypothetical protein